MFRVATWISLAGSHTSRVYPLTWSSMGCFLISGLSRTFRIALSVTVMIEVIRDLGLMALAWNLSYLRRQR